MLVFIPDSKVSSRESSWRVLTLGHLCRPWQAVLCGLSNELIYYLDPTLNELEPVDKHATGKWQLSFTLMAWPSGLSFGWSQTGILCTDSPRGRLGCARTRLQEKKLVSMWLSWRLSIIAYKWPAWNTRQDQYTPAKWASAFASALQIGKKPFSSSLHGCRNNGPLP